jgi:hypothetical protein
MPSSRGGLIFMLWLGERGVFLVGGPGCQAVVQAADHAVEQVALGGGMAVAGLASAVVVGAGAGRSGQRGEGPDVPDRGEALIFDPAVQHSKGLAGCSGDRGGAGVCLDRAGVGEAGAVVAQFGENSGSGYLAQSRKAGDDLGVWVFGEGLGGRRGEFIGAGAGRVELPQQREGLPSHGLLHQGGLAHLLRGEGVA